MHDAQHVVRRWEERLGISVLDEPELGVLEQAVLELARTNVDEIPLRLVQLALDAIPADMAAYASPTMRISRATDASTPSLPNGVEWCSERRGTLADRDAPFIGDSEVEYALAACDDGWLAIAGRHLKSARAFAYAKLAGAIWMRARAEAALGEQATRDALTGLLNRRGLLDAIQRFPRGTRYVLLFGDLDGLKAANDRGGHAAGDALLKSAGAVLQSAVRTGDLVSRLGGDEFVVASLGDQPELVMARIRSALDRARIDVSWGVARVPAETSDAEEAIALADARMYEDKRARGRGRI